MNKGIKILGLACAGCVLLLALEIAAGALLGTHRQWLAWSPVSSAHAYKVERVCEEKQTKKGLQTKCKSVLVRENADEKKDVPASDKKSAPAKEEKPKQPQPGGPPKH